MSGEEVKELLKTLSRKRGSVKSRVTLFKKHVNDIQNVLSVEGASLNDAAIIELESRIQKFEPLIDEYEGHQMLIECNVEADVLEEQVEERESFENSYYAILSAARKILGDYTTKPELSNALSSAASVAASQEQSSHLRGIRLPTIQLPKFNGSYDTWLEFRDTFQSLIHSNEGINEVQKFHYLRAALEGDAAQVIKSLEFSATNYITAWDVLCSRFDNNRLLVHNHVKSLFGIESISKECSVKIRKLIDTVSKHLRALESLGEPTKAWDTLIIHIISTKLDSITLRKWEGYKAEKEIPTLENMKDFLKGRADLLETLEVSQIEKRGIKNNDRQATTRSFVTANGNCRLCKSDHTLANCGEFLKLSASDRAEKVKSLRLCLNCFKSGHFNRFCRAPPCKKCKYKHNSLIHVDYIKKSADDQKAKEATAVETADGQNTAGKSVALTTHYASQRQVLLSTACVQIFDEDGKAHNVRALLDSGSRSSFMTMDLCNKLKLNAVKVDLTVVGLNNAVSTIKFKCETEIRSQHNAFNTRMLCFVVPEIAGNLPNFNFDLTNLNIPKHIKLADPWFNKPAKIDMLIGSDLFWNLICVGQISIGSNGPILQKTKLGWVVSGPISTKHSNQVQCNFNKNAEVQRQLTRFWEIEEILLGKPLSIEESNCEDHFIKSVKRSPDGRFTVSIPFKEPLECLGESKERARKQFLSLERKLQSNPVFRERYTNFLMEYESLNHMAKVEPNSGDDGISYFMPHHGVIREESSTTKLRVAFNGSAPSTSGRSLNDLQMVGPSIQEDLISIMLRFRKHAYVMSADIAKMYRQVLVQPEQRKLQKILWRANPMDEIQTYELNTVTYGMAAAPYLAIRCLHQIALDSRDEFPDISKIIESDFYVDDLLTGAETVEQASYICSQITRVLKGGCFELRKWHSNEPRILKFVENNSESDILEFGPETDTKTLGMRWICKTDELMYSINNNPVDNKITKRSILSSIARIFDPLGLLSPCIIVVKILLQKLWLERLSWDDLVPSGLHRAWSSVRNELPVLNNLRIQRHVICKNPVRIEVHGFSDASESAYGACIYILSVNGEEQNFVHLLCSKSKVAPLKSLTVPRLELCGALTLSRLINTAIKSLDVKLDSVTLWTDSTIVLGWLKTAPSLLKSFVSHRVAEIQEITSTYEWRHVSTKENPADLVSRGVNPSQILISELWWHGPTWLRKPKNHWPKNAAKINELPELRNKIQVLMTVHEEVINFNRFSRLRRIKRTMGIVLRFINNCKLPKEKRSGGELSNSELNDAFEVLVKIAQRKSFPQDLELLEKGKDLSLKSKILSLNPFISNNGILRVRGRLENSPFDFNKKHQVILGAKHSLTKLIFKEEHERLFHSGPQHLLASVREQFWSISGRNVARKTVHECVICFRANPKAAQALMGDLPEHRVTPAPPFYATGVDYAGPFLIKNRNGRGCKLSKCYLCLFVCFATKAIHLELVTDLTKDAFIASLRRFVSRRGKPCHIYSDNGSNFVGASSELQHLGNFLMLNENALTGSFTNEGLNWHFIPAYSPHFGGLWEAGVKSAKFHMKRVARDASLTFEELYTLFVQIEAILNSRPLSPLSSDPQDLNPITPAHFLIGRTLTSLPDPNLTDIAEGRLSRYQRIQQINQHFWARWGKEYVSELQQRTKWKIVQPHLTVDTMVVIKDDNLPPMKWQLGRVVQLHPGADGVSRVVSIRTSKGIVRRAITKICPLPIEQQEAVTVT